MVKFNDLKCLHSRIFNGLQNAVAETILHDNLIMGQAVESFEKAFSEYNHVKECVSVASGTDALMLALQAVGVKPGGEVITVANSAPATVAAIRSIGAVPVYIDIDSYGLMDPEKIKPALTLKTAAIVPVHLYGRTCEMERIAMIARERGIAIVEDAAQAVGSYRWNDRPGIWSEATAWSFYPTKNLGCLGDGGAVTTRDLETAGTVRMLRNYGMSDRTTRRAPGRNSRLDTIQAAVLLYKMKYLDDWNKERTMLGEIYNTLLPESVKRKPIVGENYHLYTIHHPRREELRVFLGKRGIETLIHYETIDCDHPVNVDLGWKKPLDNTRKHCKTVLSLPLWPGMTESSMTEVIAAVRDFVDKQ